MKNKILYGISTAIWFIATAMYMIITFKMAKSGPASILPFIMITIVFVIVYIIIFVMNILALIANRASSDFKKDAIFWLEMVNLVLPFISVIAGILLYKLIA